MKYFGTQTYYLLDKSKPYQRPELRHAGPNDVNREAELERPSRVACSDLLGVMVICGHALCHQANILALHPVFLSYMRHLADKPARHLSTVPEGMAEDHSMSAP